MTRRIIKALITKSRPIIKVYIFVLYICTYFLYMCIYHTLDIPRSVHGPGLNSRSRVQFTVPGSILDPGFNSRSRVQFSVPGSRSRRHVRRLSNIDSVCSFDNFCAWHYFRLYLYNGQWRNSTAAALSDMHNSNFVALQIACFHWISVFSRFIFRLMDA